MQSRITAETVAAYLVAVEDLSLDGVQRACTAFAKGLVTGFNNDFAPTAARLAEEARKYDKALATLESVRNAPKLIRCRIGEKPPPGTVPIPFVEDGGRKEFAWSVPRITLGDADGKGHTGEAA